MVIKKLKPEMTVYDCRLTKGLQRFNSKWSTYNVYVKEVDIENNKVLASWNGNPAEWYSERTWKKWRIKRPEK